MNADPLDAPRARAPRRWRAPLGGLLALALLVRAGWGLTQPVNEAALEALPDQREYLSLARNLLHDGQMKFVDPRFNDEVYAFRTPGYPLFLAACGADLRVVRLAQALLDTSTVLAVYLLACRWLSPGPSLLAAAAVAVNPFLIYFTGLLLTETLFTAMLAWGMLLLVGLPRAQPPGDEASTRGGVGSLSWLLGGLVLALSVLVRPSAGALPVVLGVVAAFAARPMNRGGGAAYQTQPDRRAGTVRRLLPARWPLPVGTTMLLLTVLVLLPWAYRNWRVVGRWVWTTTNGGITAYDGFNPDATGRSDQSFVRSMPHLDAMGEVGRSDYLGALAKEYARSHPRRALELAAVKAARTWSPVPLSEEYGGLKYRVVGLLYSLPLDVLVVWGLLRGTLPRAAKVFLLTPAVYFTFVHMLSVGSLRYRVPSEPPITVVAASVFSLSVPGWRRAEPGARGLPDDAPTGL